MNDCLKQTDPSPHLSNLWEEHHDQRNRSTSTEGRSCLRSYRQRQSGIRARFDILSDMRRAEMAKEFRSERGLPPTAKTPYD